MNDEAQEKWKTNFLLNKLTRNNKTQFFSKKTLLATGTGTFYI